MTKLKWLQGHVSRMSWGARIAAFGAASSLCGALYGGFLMYQKVEEVASLDLGCIPTADGGYGHQGYRGR
jgi:hypothetical protein